MPAPTKHPEGTLGHRRQTLGKGQITIADECGIEQATVSRWENGKNFPRDPKVRGRMLDAYGCASLSELFGLLAQTAATLREHPRGTLEYVSRLIYHAFPATTARPTRGHPSPLTAVS